MVLHYYPVHQEFDDSSKCLVYNRAHHSVSYGELNKLAVSLGLEYICSFICICLAYQSVFLQTEACALITTLVSLKSSMYKNTLTGSVAFKKIKLRSYDTASPQLVYNGQSGNGIVPSEMSDSIKSSVYAADKLSSTEIKFSKSHSAMQVFLSFISVHSYMNASVICICF